MMMMYNNIENLMSKNDELKQQIVTLEKDCVTTVSRDYIVKSRELYFKILELISNENELCKHMGSNAPCTASLIYKKNFPTNYMPF
jgi:hypothetical protein